MNIKSNLLLIILAIAGGAAFALIRAPLPWMLGPVAAIALWGVRSGQALRWPQPLTEFGVILIAYAMGRTFTVNTLYSMGAQLPLMIAATGLTVLGSMAAGLAITRFAGMHPYSSIIGCMPGGLSQMVLLGAELKEANTAEIALLQTVRLIAVVFAVPFIVTHGWLGTIGADAAPSGTAPFLPEPPFWRLLPALALCTVCGFAAQLLRLPTPFFMGAVLGAAALAIGGYALPPLPAPLLMTAQLSIGIHIGTRIEPGQLRNIRRLGPWSVIAAFWLLALSTAIAAGIAVLADSTLVSSFLAASPGGLSEMGATAIAVGADLPLVTAFQMFRLFFILFLIPPLLRWVLPKLVPGGHPKLKKYRSED